MPAAYEGMDIILCFHEVEIYHVAKLHIISRQRYIIIYLLKKNSFSVVFEEITKCVTHCDTFKTESVISVFIERQRRVLLYEVSPLRPFIVAIIFIL